MHLVVINCVQVLDEPIITNQTIIIVFKVEFLLHGLMESVSDVISYYHFSQNFVVFAPVGI